MSRRVRGSFFPDSDHEQICGPSESRNAVAGVRPRRETSTPTRSGAPVLYCGKTVARCGRSGRPSKHACTSRDLYPRARRERAALTHVAHGGQLRRLSRRAATTRSSGPRRGLRSRDDHRGSRAAGGARASARRRTGTGAIGAGPGHGSVTGGHLRSLARMGGAPRRLVHRSPRRDPLPRIAVCAVVDTKRRISVARLRRSAYLPRKVAPCRVWPSTVWNRAGSPSPGTRSAPTWPSR